MDGLRTASDTLIYNEKEIARIAKTAFEIARKRRKKVCSVDKANVLDSSRLWRRLRMKVSTLKADIWLITCHADKNPTQFDVILVCWHILSDGSMITSSKDAGASLGKTKLSV